MRMNPFPFDMDGTYVRLFFLLSGILVFFFIARYAAVALSSRNWKRTEGNVESYNFAKGNIADEQPDMLEISYKFSLSGKEYSGNKVSIRNIALPDFIFGTNAYLSRKIHRKLNRGDMKVTIFYDPDNPQKNCMDISIDCGVLVSLLVFFCVFIIFLMWP
jgi:hypothetical protein